MFAFQSLSPFKQHLWNCCFFRLLPPCTRSQSLRDGPVSSWFWTQWWCPQPQKPFGSGGQRNSKQCLFSPNCISMHWPHIWFLLQIYHKQQPQQLLSLKFTYSFFTPCPFFKAINLLYFMSILSSGSVGWWTQRDASDWMLISFQSSLQRAWQASKQL